MSPPQAPGAEAAREDLHQVTAGLDGLENGNHVGVTETECAGLAIERVANIEQRRGDPCRASRFGDEAVVLQGVRDRRLDREIAADELRRLYTRDVTGHRPSVQNGHELIKVKAVAVGEMHGFGEAGNERDQE